MRRLLIGALLAAASMAWAVGPVCDICGVDVPTHFVQDNIHFQTLPYGVEMVNPNGISDLVYRATGHQEPVHKLLADIRIVLCDSCFTVYGAEIQTQLDSLDLLRSYRKREAKRIKEVQRLRVAAAKADTIQQIAEHEKQLRILKGKPLPADTAAPFYFESWIKIR